MIRIKMIELLNCSEIINKMCKYNSPTISIQFKLKVGMLHKNLKQYIDQYYIKMHDLINKYEIEIIEGQIVSKSEVKIKEFLNSKCELDNMEIEINEQKIVLDKNINNLDLTELFILTPFFDYGEIEQGA